MGAILGIRRVSPGVACGENTGCAVQGVDTQAGVVSENPARKMDRCCEGLEYGIFRKRLPCFLWRRDFRMRTKIVHLKMAGKHRANFLSLVGVFSGDDERLHE